MGVTICRECSFAERMESGEPTGHCLNEKAPVSDYVYGFRRCVEINKGDCGFFVKSKP